MLSTNRWATVLDLLADILGAPPRRVLVVGGGRCGPLVTDALRRSGHDAKVSGHDPAADDGVVIQLRSRRGETTSAGIVVDVSDPAWPVLRHVDPALGYQGPWHDTETQAFFAAKADTWDTRFGEDLPAYARAVSQMRLSAGAVVVDVGCGTGRALPALRAAVGPQGRVVGVDFTAEMLDTCRRLGRSQLAHLVLANARQLPLGDAVASGVFAAGLIGHLPDVRPVLTELARVSRPDGALVLFHPSGRAALAARHGRGVRPDEPLSPATLPNLLEWCGWRLERYDDAADRFFALARRQVR